MIVKPRGHGEYEIIWQREFDPVQGPASAGTKVSYLLLIRRLFNL
jgi:hypothetical protein